MKKSGLKNRREFLKDGLAGVAGIAMLSFSSSGAGKTKKDKRAAKSPDSGTRIVCRKLGRTGIELPIISIGTGDTNDPGLIKAALDKGVRLLATSQYYGNGNNERIVGEVIKGRSRDSVIVMTSTMPEDFNHKEGVFNKGARVEPFVERFHGSLERLGVDCVDIFLLAFMGKRESVLYEPYLRALEDMKKQGKARFIGIATHSYMDEAILAAVEAKIYDVALVAYNFRQDNNGKIAEAMAFASEKGLGIIAMKTMAGSFWDKERKEPINSVAALKWVLRNEHIHTAVPGVTTYDQLEKDLSVMADLSLSDREETDLRLSLHERHDGPFCQQCGRCVPQCRKGLDIPTMMRSHMYLYGHRNLAHARETLEYAGRDSDPCAGCADCTVSCAMNFDVRSKITKVARLNNVPEEFIS